MRFSLVFLFVFFVVISLSSDCEAEENFTISVDPGWMDWKERNCRMVTDPDPANGTYEECDYYLEYETSLTNTTFWSIGGNGDYHRVTTQSPSSSIYYAAITTISPDSTFVFSLNGINFSNDIEYTFSYEVRACIGNCSEQLVLAESQVTFFGNDSIETNLSGTFDSYLNEETLPLKDKCEPVQALVKLEGTNVSTNNSLLLAVYISEDFTFNDATAECKLVYSYNDAGFSISLGDYALFLVPFLVFGLAIIYGQAKLTSWHFTGSYSNKSTQYLAILVSAILFIFLAMFPVAFFIAVIVLFAQFVAYYTGHYDKPEEPGDSEGDLVDTKKSMVGNFRALLLLTGIIFIFFGLNVLMTCSLSMPPQCGTLIEASPCFSVSLICFILFFYLGRKDKSKIDNKLEISEEDQPKPK